MPAPVCNLFVMVLLILSSVASGADLTIEELKSAVTRPAVSLKAPLVAENDDSWTAQAPLWTGQSKNITAKFWMATTTKAFLIRILVTDPKQENPFHERNLWRGDCIYLSINARNDATPEALKTGQPAPDDATYLFGLGDRGAEGRIVRHGNPIEAYLDQTPLIRKLARDENAKTTTYDLTIPFEKLSTAFGMSSSVGVALCIAHKDSDGNDMNWGRMLPTKDGPRQLNTIALDSGKGTLVSVAPRNIRFADPKAPAEVTVALRLPADDTLTAKIGTHQQTMAVPGDNALHRYLVRVPGELIQPDAAEITIVPARQQSQATFTFPITTPAVLMHRLSQKIARLRSAAPADNAIFRDHLDSTLRLIKDSHDHLPPDAVARPEAAKEFMDYVERIASKLPADRYDFADHVSRCIPLVFAFDSAADHSLQFYSLQLPFAFDPAKTYPLTVYLHGMGSENPLDGLSASFDNSSEDTLFRTVRIDPAHIPASHRGFVLAPWARGNSFFRGPAAADTWQTIDMVAKRFKIDSDRVYLTGFSMGCSGAMDLAAHRPDFFAGINLASGFGPWSQTSKPYLVDNVRGLAIDVWIGELDGMCDDAKAFHQLLTDKKMDHRFTVLPRTPHTYPYDEFQQNVAYLMQFPRQRHTEFTYTADTPEASGRNGIYLAVPRAIPETARPTFSAKITGQILAITSANTTGLTVDLPTLGMTRNVQVIWNGKEAYAGPAKPIELGTDAPRRP